MSTTKKQAQNVLNFTEKDFQTAFNQASKEDFTTYFAVFKLLQFAKNHDFKPLFDAIGCLVTIEKGFNYRQASNNQLRKITDALLALRLFEKHLPHLTTGVNYTFAKDDAFELSEEEAKIELPNLPEGCEIVVNGDFLNICKTFQRKKIVGDKIEVAKDILFVAERQKYTLKSAFTVIRKELKAKKLFATAAKEKAPQKKATTTNTAAKKDDAQNEVANKIDKKKQQKAA